MSENYIILWRIKQYLKSNRMFFLRMYVFISLKQSEKRQKHHDFKISGLLGYRVLYYFL
jgi:hypothetical protein